MSLLHARRNIPVETDLHPAVYAGLVGCVVWILASIWLAFGSDSYVALQLAVSTVLAIAFVLVPCWIAALWRAEHKPAEARSFKEWREHEFMTASGPVEAKEAAIMVLLAPASVALGISATSLIAWLAARGAI